jgi:tetratricopeptide (TPR) repeat protein
MVDVKTCFVIIGFGPKTDFESSRVVDLDKTFENLIKPVFDELGIKCFRAKEIRHTGNIDVPMYEWIYKADIVVADISTLNPNALYELGVRHALRPNTTIVISESLTKYPFDLNHTVIAKYEHLGKDIGVSEATRFKAELKQTVIEVLKSNKKDSPVYTFLPDLKPPRIDDGAIETIIDKPRIEPSFSDLLNDAENAKNNNELRVAGQLYRVCLKFEPQNVFLRQRLALVTYKFERPTPQKALLEAEEILKELNPEDTTDVETLGLSGAINKRLYDITKNEKRLDKSIWFYSKGYYISQDYYNGINLAYLITLKATLQTNKQETISYFLQSQRIREEICKACTDLIKQKTFKDRGDQEWVYQSLAQAYLGLGKENEFKKTVSKINKLSKGQFDLDTFLEQNKKLLTNIEIVKKNTNLI